MQPEPRATPLVAIVILNWNSEAATLRCADACRALGYRNVRLIVVDNGSKDGSGERIRRANPDLGFIQTGANLGYAGGNNAGIRRALRSGADFVWLLNPDTIPAPDALELLVAACGSDPRIGICGPRVRQGRPPSVFAFDGLSIRREQAYLSVFDVVDEARLDDRRAPLVDVDGVSGSSMLIRTEMLRTIGLIREDFFLYYEDTELCFRARRNCWRTTICRGAVVQHRTVADPPSPHHKQISRTFYVDRGRILFSRIEGRDVWRTMIVAAFRSRRLRATARQHGLAAALGQLTLATRIAISGLARPIRAIPAADPRPL